MLLLAAVVLAACSSGTPSPAAPESTVETSTTTTAPATTTTAAPIAVGADVAAAFEQTVGEGLRRWPDETVTIAWHGSPTERDRQTLNDFLTWLASLPRAPRLTLAADGSDADIDLHAIPKSEWTPVVGELPPDSATTTGLTRSTFAEDGTMRAADVAIDAGTDQATRNLTINHEVLHALGQAHHQCAGGLVYGGEEGSPSWTPTAFDAALLDLTYNRGIPGGATADEVAPRLVVTGNDPPCPAARYEPVSNVANQLLWCVRGLDPAPCYVMTGDHEPAPADPVASWLGAGVLTPYDPSKFEAFTTPDGPALCERPQPGRRRNPCERGENLAGVARIDFWTDGQTVYPNP